MDELEGKIWFSEQLTLALEELPAEIYQTIPYSQVAHILPKLLEAPLMAERAFHQSSDLPSLIAKMQRSALNKLCTNPEWQLASETLHQFVGMEGDRIEAARKTAIQAVNNLHPNSPPSLK